MLNRANERWPFAKATGILDSGCGPGPITDQLITSYGAQLPRDVRIVDSDFSEAMIEQVHKTKTTGLANGESLWENVEAVVLDAQALVGVENGSMSHVLAGMVYFMLPKPAKALNESLRVLDDGGVLTCSSFQDAEWIDLMSLISEVRPDKTVPQVSKAWSTVSGLTRELENAGFREVEVHRVETFMGFESHKQIVNFLVTKLPHMRLLTSDMEQREVAMLERIMAERLKKIHPEEPGKMRGTVLVAFGQK